jgi:hypothetical protein
MLRERDIVKIDKGRFHFEINYHDVALLNSIIGFCAYVILTIIFTVTVKYIDKDTSEYILYPLESMFEKVEALAKDPMEITKSNFE